MMRENLGHKGRVSSNSKALLATLLAAVGFMALVFGANNAKASTVGEELNPKFNHVGLFVGTTVAGNVDDLVYTPEDGDPIGIKGKYTDTNGNFSVAKADGLEFPPVEVDLDLLIIDGKISLTKDGSGNYNAATGEMSLNLALALELGVNDLAALSEEVGIPLGTGQLACEFAPLNVVAGTNYGWPHPGKAFEDKANFKEGAIGGGWRSKPSAKATVGEQSVCNIIGGFLKPVGGIWMADSAVTLSTMPDATEPEWKPETCAEHGMTGTFPLCKEIEEPKCPEGEIGTPPDCTPPPPPAKCVVASVKVGKGKARAGKAAKVKVVVRNTGDAACKGRVALKSNKGFAKVAKNVAVNVAPGKSQTKTVTVRTTKRAKGKVRITASYSGKKGTGVVTVQAAKKKRR